MATLKTLVADCRDLDGTLLEVPDRTAPYSYSDFVQNVWKSGNLLGHYGVHPGAEVTVVAGAKTGTGSVGRIDAADPVAAILGATVVGAAVRLQPVEPVDSRALVVPAAWVDRYETKPSCSVLAYGGPPEDASVVHFEQEMWSENPVEPPESVAADDPAITAGSAQFTHSNLVEVATDIEAEYGLETGDTVVLDAALTEPGALVAGVLAPMSAGATVLVEQEASEQAATESPALVVTDESDVSRENGLQAATVTQRLRDTRRA